jgi:hypothetical protein
VSIQDQGGAQEPESPDQPQEPTPGEPGTMPDDPSPAPEAPDMPSDPDREPGAIAARRVRQPIASAINDLHRGHQRVYRG